MMTMMVIMLIMMMMIVMMTMTMTMTMTLTMFRYCMNSTEPFTYEQLTGAPISNLQTLWGSIGKIKNSKL